MLHNTSPTTGGLGGHVATSGPNPLFTYVTQISHVDVAQPQLMRRGYYDFGARVLVSMDAFLRYPACFKASAI